MNTIELAQPETKDVITEAFNKAYGLGLEHAIQFVTECRDKSINLNPEVFLVLDKVASCLKELINKETYERP